MGLRPETVVKTRKEDLTEETRAAAREATRLFHWAIKCYYYNCGV